MCVKMWQEWETMCVKMWQEWELLLCVTNGGRSGYYVRLKWWQEWELCMLQMVAGVGTMCVKMVAGVGTMCYKMAGVGTVCVTYGGRSGKYVC